MKWGMWFRGPTIVGATALTVTIGAAGSSPAHTSVNGAWWEWASSIPADGGGYTEGEAVVELPDGSLVAVGDVDVVGYFPTSQPASDDSIALMAPNGGVYVAGSDPNEGGFAWASAALALAGGSIYPYAATVLNPTTVVITGQFDGTAIFPLNEAGDDSVALTAQGTDDGFVAAFDVQSRSFAWAQRVGAPGQQTIATSVSADAGGVLVTGPFAALAYFPTSADDSIAIARGGGDVNGYVAYMSGDDSYFDWVQPIVGTGGGLDTISIQTVAANGSGDRVIGGFFQGEVSFPVSPSSSQSISAAGSFDIFVARMNADDSYFSWAQSAGGIGVDQAFGIAVDDEGRSLLTGAFGGTAHFPTSADDSVSVSALGSYDAVIAQVNADDSYFSWVSAVGGTGSDNADTVAIAADGSPVVALNVIGSVSLPSGPSADDSIFVPWTSDSYAIIAGLNADDSYFAWAQTAGGGSGDYLYALGLTITDGCAPVVTGGFGLSASFPQSATEEVTLSAPSAYDSFLAVLNPPGCRVRPTPVPPSPPAASSAPQDVSAVADDGAATVSWAPPSSSGSFPVSNYQVTSSPGGRTCLVAAPSLSCEVAGLANGTAYTFTVRALNGAGWSPPSEASSAVTPTAPPAPTLVIVGSREGKRIEVSGTATGFGEGGVLRPWLRFRGQPTYSQGKATILISRDGSFEWGRRTGKRVSLYVQTPDRSVRSNAVTIPAP